MSCRKGQKCSTLTNMTSHFAHSCLLIATGRSQPSILATPPWEHQPRAVLRHPSLSAFAGLQPVAGTRLNGTPLDLRCGHERVRRHVLTYPDVGPWLSLCRVSDSPRLLSPDGFPLIALQVFLPACPSLYRRGSSRPRFLRLSHWKAPRRLSGCPVQRAKASIRLEQCVHIFHMLNKRTKGSDDGYSC
jgi:hypothetical protein